MLVISVASNLQEKITYSNTLNQNIDGSSFWMCIKIFSFLYSVSLDEDEAADGSLFYDDGESLETVEHGEYFLGEITMREGEIRMSVVTDRYRGMDSLNVERIIVLGLRREVAEVTVNGLPHTEWTYKAGGLMINNLILSPNENFTIQLK